MSKEKKIIRKSEVLTGISLVTTTEDMSDEMNRHPRGGSLTTTTSVNLDNKPRNIFEAVMVKAAREGGTVLVNNMQGENVKATLTKRKIVREPSED